MKNFILSIGLCLLFLFSNAQITIKLNATGNSYEVLNAQGVLETFGPLNTLMGGYNATTGALTLYTIDGNQPVITNRLFSNIIDGSTGFAFPSLAALKVFVAANFFQGTGGGGGDLPSGTPTQIMGFASDNKPMAKAFSADMWTNVPDVIPTGSILLSSVNMDNSTDYKRATADTVGSTIPIRNANGTVSVSNGVNPLDATNMFQRNQIVVAIDGITNDIQSINQNAAGKSLNNTFTGTNTFTKAVIVDTINHIASGNSTKLIFTTPTATNTILFPNKSMTVAGLDDVAELDSRVVHLTGSETITGAKSFTWPVSIIGANLSVSNDVGTTSTEYGSAAINYIVGSFGTTLGFVTPTKNNSLLAPNKNGTLATLDDISAGGGSAQVVISGSTTGTMICSMPFMGVNYKKVLINLNGMIGTATYVFPTSFRVGPDVSLMKSNQQISISSLTNTQVVIDNSNQQGFLSIEGY